MICLTCPQSCHLETIDEMGDIFVTGNACKKGVEFAKRELITPERTLTSTIRIEQGTLPLVSVRSDVPVKKNELLTIIRQLDNIILTAPVFSGEIVASNFGENRVNIIATRTVEEQCHSI